MSTIPIDNTVSRMYTSLYIPQTTYTEIPIENTLSIANTILYRAVTIYRELSAENILSFANVSLLIPIVKLSSISTENEISTMNIDLVIAVLRTAHKIGTLYIDIAVVPPITLPCRVLLLIQIARAVRGEDIDVAPYINCKVIETIANRIKLALSK